MKRITIVIAACLVYMLFVSVFGFINKNDSKSEKTDTYQSTELVTNGYTDPCPPPPFPPPKP